MSATTSIENRSELPLCKPMLKAIVVISVLAFLASATQHTHPHISNVLITAADAIGIGMFVALAVLSVKGNGLNSQQYVAELITRARLYAWRAFVLCLVLF